MNKPDPLVPMGAAVNGRIAMGQAPGQYRVRVTSTTNAAATDISDSDFLVDPLQ